MCYVGNLNTVSSTGDSAKMMNSIGNISDKTKGKAFLDLAVVESLVISDCVEKEKKTYVHM